MKTLSDICEVYSGFALKEFNDLNEGIPVIKIGNIMTDGTLALGECQYTSEIVNEKYYSKKGDIYVALSGATTGKIGILESDERHVINQRVGVIRRKDDEVPQQFIKYFLMRQTDRIMQEASGCAQPNISPKQIAQYEVPRLSKTEMYEISTILDMLSNVITQRKDEIQKLEALIKARFVELFGDPITNPMKWKKEETNKHIDLLSGYPFKSEQYVEEGINICGGLIIMPQRIEWESCVHWPTVQGYEDYLLEDGDIVMALDRPWITEGFKVARVDGNHLPALLIQRTARIRALDINQDYLYYCFINGGFDKHSNVTGSLVPHISAKDIRSFEIMVPPIELQEEFSKFMNQADKSKVAVQKALDEAQLLFDSLMQEYFG